MKKNYNYNYRPPSNEKKTLNSQPSKKNLVISPRIEPSVASISSSLSFLLVLLSPFCPTLPLSLNLSSVSTTDSGLF